MPKGRLLEGEIIDVTRAMKECTKPSEYKRLQCVYLGMLYPDMSAKRIGEITLYSESRVWAIHAEYRKNGLSGLSDARGGRYRQHLSFDEEVEFLKPFAEKSKSGALVEVSAIKKAYEKIVRKEVAKTTIYRLLDRHDFRKIVPYKRHKKANIEEQEAFKKTLLA
jgi:transposase